MSPDDPRLKTHTPGPWAPMEGLESWINAIHNPYGCGTMHVADIRGWGHLTGASGCNMPEDMAAAIQLANARLISAAPELLTALSDIIGCIEAHDFNPLDCDRRGDTYCNCIDTRIAKAKAVIAKATGEAVAA